MKLAVIPPYCYSNYMLLSDYQLVLPECFRSESYTKCVYQMRKRNDFIILDNGAAEGGAWHPNALLAVAREFEVDEIVVPDVMMDKEGTLDLLEKFITEADTLEGFKFMGVPQGTKEQDFIHCIEAFAEMDWITTIGIPRHMLQTLDNKYARAEFAEYINLRFGNRFEIHFLGSSAQWLGEPQFLQSQCGSYARGMDTSLPFYAAYEGVEIDMIDPPIIARPEEYFELPAFQYPIHIVEYNMRKLKGWLIDAT